MVNIDSRVKDIFEFKENTLFKRQNEIEDIDQSQYL